MYYKVQSYPAYDSDGQAIGEQELDIRKNRS